MIEVNQITFDYNGRQKVFDDFSCTIPNGIYGMVGINGAGKSTLLKLLLGLIHPQHGEILINDKNMKTQRFELLKSIGVIFENANFPPWMKVYEHLVYVGQLRGLTRHESMRQVDELLVELDLDQKRNDKVNTLSAGLTQRFAIAQACLGSPAFLFLDEPTSNLDAQSRIKILKYLRTLSRHDGTNILIFSHVLSDLEKFCDAFGILHQGEIILDQTITDLIKHNHHKQYILRYTEDVDIEELKSKILPFASIIEEYTYELLINIDDNTKYNEFKAVQFQDSVTLMPSKSLLEQVFLEKTGVEL
jgi:ABC-2 type transport system ATP-binding protein